MHQVACQGCGKTFEAKRADARFHDTACRARSHRQRTELLEVHPIGAACEAVLAFEARVLQAQQLDGGLLQAARRGALLTALAAIEADLAPWRESDPSGYESALMVARASAERVARARREAMAESSTLPETLTPEANESVHGSMEATESSTLPETLTPEANESVHGSNGSNGSNGSMEATESSTLPETLTPEANESVQGSNGDTSEPKRASRSRVRATKTPRRSADDLEGLRAGLKAAIAAGLSQRMIADEIKASQSQISRFATGQGLSENARNGLAEWLNKKGY